MALPWALTDSQAKDIYTRMCNYFNSPNNFPNRVNDTGVFFGFANYTRDKLWYSIEYLKNNYSRGWFTDDFEDRSEILHSLANELYSIFGGSVDVAGIYKFLAYVYSWASNDLTAQNYFQGGAYSGLQHLLDTATEKISNPVNEVIETVKYGVNYPSFTLENPLIKWAAIAGGAILIYNMLKR